MDWSELAITPVTVSGWFDGTWRSGQTPAPVSPRPARQAFRRTWAGWGMTRYGCRCFADRQPTAGRGSFSADSYQELRLNSRQLTLSSARVGAST